MQFVRSMDGEFYLAREVAQQLGCVTGMLPYLRRHSAEPLGPTHKAMYGAMVLHLYTPERIEQIRAYMNQLSGADVGRRRRGPVRLWTRTETLHRRRGFDRARAYRNRAIQYRAQGNEKRAASMDKMSTKLTARLEKARVARHQKVHGTRVPSRSGPAMSAQRADEADAVLTGADGAG